MPYLQAASIDQFDRLLFVTLAPLLALVVLACTHACVRRLVTIVFPTLAPTTLDERCATYRQFLYRAGLALLFVTYPGISTEIVKSFR